MPEKPSDSRFQSQFEAGMIASSNGELDNKLKSDGWRRGWAHMEKVKSVPVPGATLGDAMKEQEGRK